MTSDLETLHNANNKKREKNWRQRQRCRSDEKLTFILNIIKSQDSDVKKAFEKREEVHFKKVYFIALNVEEEKGFKGKQWKILNLAKE